MYSELEFIKLDFLDNELIPSLLFELIEIFILEYTLKTFVTGLYCIG